MRNRNVEDKLGITITGVGFDVQGGESARLAPIILSGEDTYDVMIPAMNQFGALATQGLLVDLNTVPYLGLEQPWWDQNINRDLSINNKLYGTQGYINISTARATRIFLFNKTIREDYALECPYDLVRAGNWTLEKLNELGRQVAEDLNGDGMMDEHDQFGFLAQSTVKINLFFAGGEDIVVKDADDIPHIAVANNPRAVSLLTKLTDLYTSTEFVYVGGDAILRDMFGNGQGLFYAEVLGLVESLRGIEVNFGLLPAPKYDRYQEHYRHYADSWCMSLLFIPVTNENLERTGIILQAMAAESANTMVPAFYEINLHGQFFRDEESSEMLDLIIGTRVISIDEVFRWGMHGRVGGILSSLNYEITSVIETGYDSVRRAIEDTLARIG
jgi:hypothetical protein